MSYAKATQLLAKMLKRWRTVCNAMQDLIGLGFELSTKGYHSKYCISVICKLAQCIKTRTVAIARTFNACLINVYGSVFRFVFRAYMPIRILFEENKFIKLLSNLTHQLKQCIKNDNYKLRYCFALLLSQNNNLIVD